MGRLVGTLDQLLASLTVRVVERRRALLTFLFHVILPDREIGPDIRMDAGLVVSTSGFGRFIDYFLSGGYTFVTPEEIAAGLPEEGRFVLATFDDGYFNNTLALPALDEYRVPAVFCISSDHIRTGDAYWWDAVYRERSHRDSSEDAIARETAELKTLTYDAIRERVVDRFGARALRPAGDHDRPMTVDELRAFAAHPRVRIGNHTVHHAILTNHDAAGAAVEIGGAQDDLEEMLGSRPVLISYPNGNHSSTVVDVAAAAGLTVGVTTIEKANPLPLAPGSALRLGRFRFDYRNDGAAKLATYRTAHTLRGLAGRLRLE